MGKPVRDASGGLRIQVFLDRFWRVLRWIFRGFYKRFAERWGSFAAQDSSENFPKGEPQKKRRFPFHVESGLSWGCFGAQDASKIAPRRPQEAPRRPKMPPRRSKTAPRRPQDVPRRPKRRPDGPRTPKILPKWSQVGTTIGSKIDLILKTANY